MMESLRRSFFLTLIALALFRDVKADEDVWALSKTNIHQPVYTPGFGSYHAYSPLFLTPPPPQVAVSNLIPPSPVFMPSERKIKKQINVVNYPQHLDNPMNFFSMPRMYNPYFGTQHPINMNHPFNFMHGPVPFPSYGTPNYVPGFASLATMPTGVAAGIPNSMYNLPGNEPSYTSNDTLLQKTNTQVQAVNRMAAQMQQLGFNNANTQGFNPFLSEYGEGGRDSPYNMIPGMDNSRLLRDNVIGLMGRKSSISRLKSYRSQNIIKFPKNSRIFRQNAINNNNMI